MQMQFNTSIRKIGRGDRIVNEQTYQQAVEQAREEAFERYLNNRIVEYRKRNVDVVILAGTTHAIAIVFGMWLFSTVWGA